MGISPQGRILAKNIHDLQAEIIDWVAGNKSHWNDFEPTRTPHADIVALCAVADAAEVVKLSAALQAYVALAQMV